MPFRNRPQYWSDAPEYFLCPLEALRKIPAWIVLNPTDNDAHEMGPPVAGIFLKDAGMETQSYKGPFLGYLLQARNAPAASHATHLAFQLLSDGVENTFRLSPVEKREIVLKIVGTAIATVSRQP